MDERFWQAGVRFECQGTGKCCTSRGEYGYVYLTRADRRRLADHLGTSTGELMRTHCDVTEGHVHLKDPERDCVFLSEKRCTVYEARPTQCRTWPFWPENMNAKVWTEEVASTCPGIGKGSLLTAPDIDALVQLGKLSTKK